MAERLGQYLLRKEAISQSQLKEALRTQQFFGGNLGSHLIQLGYLDEDELGRALSDIHGVAYAGQELLRRPAPEAIKLLPADFVRKHRAVPFRVDGGELHVALVNPRDALGIHEASFLTGMSVVPHVAPEFRILQAIERHYHLRLDRRRGIRVQGPADGADPSQPPESSDTAGDRTEPEMGLDGRPLDAPPDPAAYPEWQASSAAHPSASRAPRSLDEWRGRPASPPPTPPPAGPAAAPPRSARAQGAAATLQDAAQSIAEARTRDEVGRVALRWLAGRYRRAALFSVHKNTVIGWDGVGPDFEPERIKKIQVDLDTRSIFSSFSDGRHLYYGPVANLPVHQDLYTYLGGRLPSSVLVVPVILKGRIVAILYADNGTEAMPPPDLLGVRRLAAKVSLGLEALILRNKILSA